MGMESDETEKARRRRMVVKMGRSLFQSRFHIKLVATYLTPVILLPLFVFHNTRVIKCLPLSFAAADVSIVQMPTEIETCVSVGNTRLRLACVDTTLKY